jgi:hypothetical protein
VQGARESGWSFTPARRSKLPLESPEQEGRYVYGYLGPVWTTTTEKGGQEIRFDGESRVCERL